MTEEEREKRRWLALWMLVGLLVYLMPWQNFFRLIGLGLRYGDLF